MSRLIVKNLPSYVTPERLREHFLQKGGPGGTLTDVKISHKQDGTSRRFGFVGFKSEAEASAAQKWFDRTFIDTTRISVSISEGAKDAPTPRPNKRRRLDAPNVEPTEAPPTHTTSSTVPKKTNKQLDDFLEVMKPKKGPSWANEATSLPVPITSAAEEPEAPTGDLDDMEWMRRHMSKAVDVEDKVFEQSDNEDESPAEPTVASPSKEDPQDETKKTILATSRLFVRNLAYSCTDQELTDLFSPFGELTQVHTPRDPSTQQHKGVAYVTFRQSPCALAAYEALDQTTFQGRLLHILAAVDRKSKYEVLEAEGSVKRTVKQEKDAKRKTAAGKDFNWSMLYMNSDAVASSIADRLKIDKADILNDDSSSTNPAVKLALAETHIIQETKTYLESQGVLLSSFASKSKSRSPTTILVKNIPYGTSETQIRELFEPHGELSRVIVPPAGTMAVVEYERPGDADKGFKAVAYRRLGNSIIYLEKGPVGMFDESFNPSKAPSTTATSSTPAHVVRIPEQLAAEDDGSSTDPSSTTIQAGTTLYVKNIAFSTTAARFSSVFANLPSFSFARIQTKPDPNHPEKRLSMGYGFVGFKDKDGAAKALKGMQGFVLDGHSLHVSLAGRGKGDEDIDDAAKQKAKATTTKMIVKNVPFEASKKDIRDLFGSHGSLKSVRLPKKFDSRSRGFAFLEFTSRHEAENAYNTLRHTHLLGRHLVLEWAEEGEQDIEALRKKAGVGFGVGPGGKAMPGKKKKLELGKRKLEEEMDGLEDGE